MRNILNKATIIISLLLCWSILAFAVDVPSVGRVVDTTATLKTNEILSIEQLLQSFEMKKGVQIVVLMVPTTAPETIEQYGLRVAETWKIGRKNIDDGAILLIAKNDRVLRMEVGYGLEGILTDAMCKRIISETIAPLFKQGNFADGIQAGLSRMIRIIDDGSQPTSFVDGNSTTNLFFPILIYILIVPIVIKKYWGEKFGIYWREFLLSPLAVALLSFFISIIWDPWIYSLVAAILAFVFAFAIAPVRYLVSHGYSFRGFGGSGSSSGGFGGGGGGFGGGGASGGW